MHQILWGGLLKFTNKYDLWLADRHRRFVSYYSSFDCKLKKCLFMQFYR